jgi:hypothetical protein
MFRSFSQIGRLTWLRLRLAYARRAIDCAKTRAQMLAATDSVIAIHRKIKFIEQERQ